MLGQHIGRMVQLRKPTTLRVGAPCVCNAAAYQVSDSGENIRSVVRLTIILIELVVQSSKTYFS